MRNIRPGHAILAMMLMFSLLGNLFLYQDKVALQGKVKELSTANALDTLYRAERGDAAREAYLKLRDKESALFGACLNHEVDPKCKVDESAASWAILTFNEQMTKYEDMAKSGSYYYWGNLADFTLPVLRLMARAHTAGLVPQDQVVSSIDRVQKYSRDNDTGTRYFLEELRASIRPK